MTRAHAADGVLGANFNQNLDSVNYRELQAARATWIRGFFTMPAADHGDPADTTTLRTVLDAARRGYGTALSLKFPLAETEMPAAGTEAMAGEMARLEKVLPVVMGRVDLLVIGNEPFIESRPQDRTDVLNHFYEAVAQRVIAYRRAHCAPACKTRLYMGALNRLDLPDRRTPAAERWMRFVRETPDIQGVDIHPHVPSREAAQPFLDYVLPRLRPNQTFLATEFSLVWYWKEHMGDPVSAGFAERYGFPADAKVWQVIQAAIARPFPQQQWDDFLSSSPWLESQKHYLRDQMETFRATGRLAMASYGFRQDTLMVQNFGPDKVPWLLNSVFAPYTVQSAANGLAGRGYPWIDDFRDLQLAPEQSRGDEEAVPGM
ncbi:hypothetical protein [Micromonospora sp. ATA51]|uniref:hypothetical protein n=1 Tax=Micromonospora sp. ATA51 TaxID=2806098 RepID=UPI001A4C0950|nr:hypothetical protein [Micromonospora sp. ATA51]MBM0224886.1 hypothetical protein [Micromonospora sp. ATA51]